MQRRGEIKTLQPLQLQCSWERLHGLHASQQRAFIFCSAICSRQDNLITTPIAPRYSYRDSAVFLTSMQTGPETRLKEASRGFGQAFCLELLEEMYLLGEDENRLTRDLGDFPVSRDPLLDSALDGGVSMIKAF